MKFAEEEVNPNEEAIISEMVRLMIERQEKRHKAGTVAKRFLHGKSLGVANAIFTINELPSELSVGLFSYPKEYRAVVRFSNGTFSPDMYDIVGNVRGLAVKLFGVPGKKLLTGEETSSELDFILANDPAFFVSKIEDMQLLVQGKFLEILMKSSGTIGRALAASNKLVTSTLDIDYFSQVPYRFGDKACKFSLSHDSNSGIIPNVFDKDYLRHGLEKQLRKEQQTFTFNMQFQEPGDSLSDSTKRWNGPFVPLAELRLLQTNKEINETDGEDLSFNPFRTIAEHEALAWPGRLRKAIYAADFKWRNEINDGEKETRSAA